MDNLSAWDPDRALHCIRTLESTPGALLPILHALQEHFGYIDQAAVPLIAESLNISAAEVHGVISFYRDFRSVPPGRHVVRICRAEACRSMSCDRLIAHVESCIGIELGRTSEDGAFTLEQTFCLGLCGVSPAMMFDGRPYGRVSPEIADFLIHNARRM